MRIEFFKKLIWVISVSLILILALPNCTCKISEEDYNKLQDLRREERQLAADISKKREDKNAIERELKARQTEADKCKEEQDFIQKKLTQWPNVWPDYVPAP